MTALGVLQEHLKAAVEHPDLASRGHDQPVDARYGWFATHALFTAETLWGLVGDRSAMGESRRLNTAPTPRLSGTGCLPLW